MRAPTFTMTLTLIAALSAAAPVTADAEVFRWMDERGVINYSNEAPSKSSNVKDVRVVENRLSIYTPDRATLDMVQRARERGDFWPRYERVQVQYVPTSMQSAPSGASDPCLTGDDINCYGSPVYYAGPYPYRGHRNHRLGRSHLPVGATAGNVVGSSGYIPGLSTQARGVASSGVGKPGPVVRSAGTAATGTFRAR